MTQTEHNTQEKKHHRTRGDKLALENGTRMAVTFDSPQQSVEGRIAADLVGMVHFEYIIIRLPWIPGLRSRLVSGAVATVRFISNGELCAFQSPVIAHTPRPSLLLFLEYPEVIEKLALRQHKRIQCALPVQILSRRGDARGVIGDLSRGGCRMTLDVQGQKSLRQTVVEDVIVLRIPLNTDNMLFTVTCTVRSVSCDMNRMHLGLVFTEADESFWTSLESFLTTAYLLA